MTPTNHSGDCTIYRAAVNKRAFDGICTCGFGWDCLRKGDDSQMMSQERLLFSDEKCTDIEHTCCVCGLIYTSHSKKDASDIQKAARTNKDGPYCNLCYHLEFAARYAEARGFHGVREVFDAWKTNPDVLSGLDRLAR